MAENFRPWAKALRNLCLKKLKEFGGRGTAKQICDATGKDAALITPRLTELADLGAIKDSGERVSAGRGRPQIVWEVVDLCDTSSADVTDQADEPPGTNDGRADDVPDWFRRFGN